MCSSMAACRAAIGRCLQDEGERRIHRSHSFGQPREEPVVVHHGQVECPMRLDVAQARAYRRRDSLKRADLRLDLEHERIERPVEPQASEVAPVGIAGMSTRLYTVLGRQR